MKQQSLYPVIISQIALLLMAVSAGAAVTVTNSGLTGPTIGTGSTGFTGLTGATDQRISLDQGDTISQTFQVSTSGNIQEIWLGYNDFTANGSGVIRIRVDVDNNGTFDFTSTDMTVLPADFETTGTNAGPFSWMVFSFVGESVSLVANQTAKFTVVGVTETGTDNYIFASRYSTAGNYSLGNASATPTNVTGTSPDFAFAVIIPEPSSLLLFSIGCLFLLRRHR